MSRKGLLVILDGLADEPNCLTDNLTPTESAYTPTLDTLAREHGVAICNTVPPGMPCGSETSIPYLLGAPSEVKMPSRTALECRSLGIQPQDNDLSFRLSFDSRRALDVDAILMTANDFLGAKNSQSRRITHDSILVVVSNKRGSASLLSELSSHLSNKYSSSFRIWADNSADFQVCNTTPIQTNNHAQRSFLVCGEATYYVRGLGEYLGYEVVVPEGATGDDTTDLTAKAKCAIEILKSSTDTVCAIHVEAPDTLSHLCAPVAKKRFIEKIDSLLLAPLYEFACANHFPLTIIPDHATSSLTGRHIEGPVVFTTTGATMLRKTDKFSDRLSNRLRTTPISEILKL